MTLGELTMTIQDAVNRGLVAAKVSGAGPGVTSRLNLSLNPTALASGPMNINIPRGTMFWPLDSGFQAHPTTQEKNVTVPLGSNTVAEIPTLCGDVYGKQPAPVDGSVAYKVGDPSPFFSSLFDTIENSTGNLTEMANGFGIPIQVYIPTVAQWTVWSFFSDPPFVPTIDPVTGEMHCFFSGDPVAIGDQVCNGCGVPFRRVTLVDGRLVVDDGGGQTPGQDGGSGAGTSWTNLTGAGVAGDRKGEQTADGGSTPQGTNTYTPPPPFNIATGLAIVSDQFSGRNVDDNTKKVVTTGLFDGVDFTAKVFVDANKMAEQAAHDLMFNNPGPGTPPPFRDKQSGLVMEYHNKTQFHPKDWNLLKDGKWHPPTAWRQDPATGVWWVTDANGRPNHPAFYFQVGDKWFPPVGMENAMSVRSDAIAKAYTLEHASKTIMGAIDNVEDPTLWFFTKTYYECLDAFSGGTFTAVEKQENLGTLQGWADAAGTGVWNFGNMASFGISNHVYDTLMKDPELKAAWEVLYDDDKSWVDKALAFNAIIAISTKDVGTATYDAVADMIPTAEIEVMMDPKATQEEKVKAGLMAIAKIANMIAIILGIKAATAKAPPEAPQPGATIEKPPVEAPTIEKPAVETPTAKGPVVERPPAETPGAGKAAPAEPEAAGGKGTWENPEMEPKTPAHAEELYTDYMKTEATAEAAGNFKEQLDLATQEQVPGVEDMAKNFNPSDSPLQNQMKAEQVLEARLRHLGYDLDMPAGDFNKIQEMSTRAHSAEGLKPQDIADLQGAVNGNPHYFEDLPARGHMTDFASKPWNLQGKMPQEGFVAALEAADAGQLKQAFLDAGGYIP